MQTQRENQTIHFNLTKQLWSDTLTQLNSYSPVDSIEYMCIWYFESIAKTLFTNHFGHLCCHGSRGETTTRDLLRTNQLRHSKDDKFRENWNTKLKTKHKTLPLEPVLLRSFISMFNHHAVCVVSLACTVWSDLVLCNSFCCE